MNDNEGRKGCLNVLKMETNYYGIRKLFIYSKIFIINESPYDLKVKLNIFIKIFYFIIKKIKYYYHN